MNRALLVGINRYQAPLRGCVNDVENMRRLLTEHCGFSVLQVRTLVDERATKQRIMDSLSLMIEQAQPGDHLVFHFSGHGSQVPDTEGDEPDAMDEILCPHDFDWTPDRYITDDEMHDVCALLDPGATLDVILDSCHSGTMLRVPWDVTPRFIPYPGQMPQMDDDKKVVRMMQGHGFLNIALFSGCMDNQTSADAYINKQHQGAMTWAFCKNVSRFDGGKDRQQLIQNLQYELEYKGYQQTPELEAQLEMRKRKIFT